ncbi:di/tricarboxylate transporter [Pelomonas saccharophila]|uniref:Di/tricarboxylate transporter n=1 Tax=Roseateles saccharophilus TaxID=304 RepID=A0ABU1YIU7_ROSSA|nr:hypothetical protein [Roseateles saccharophilus]MDR7268175.1 di/tricarboxylate transporter [Roseateles saccharophilus]
MTSASCALCAAAGLLCALTPLAPALAATASAQASAVVVVPVAVSAWLGVPINVQDLLLAQNAPAGPGTGALVPRVVSATTPTVLRALPIWIAAAVESRQAFGMEMVAATGSALPPRGPAAAISFGAAGNDGDGEPPLTITVAFN